MASTGVNVRIPLFPAFSTSSIGLDTVLRWGALAFGVFYGFSHQSAINSRDRSAHAQHEYERKEKLIQQARDEWQRKTQPQSGSGVISNPEDPNFDLEKYLQTVKA
ncbi:hypothetical protein D0860_06137 [Hortaea werneckii]|uniref:ATP synthase F(0) complex subunit e, mitochondrial n=1 Tax=Hortaea werneckii TaxID=91943 RepID=A0A3M7GV11_HORWE|nr:hypothetical protein D0860_06137 [Hortaea werneckii]RMZ29414.1 hypothetical protein D0859_06492 [Hortaea werneckii]